MSNDTTDARKVTPEDIELLVAVKAAIRGGKDVQVQRSGNGYTVFEVSRKIKYRTHCQSGQ